MNQAEIKSSAKLVESSQQRGESFCWSRMQAEAGQPLEAIITRKELERKYNDGEFYWGIGNALGQGINSLVQLGPDPLVKFSVMKTKPKLIDTSPAKVLCWRSYVSADGTLVDLPPAVIVLSRDNPGERNKKHHYCLVCHSGVPLEIGNHGALNLREYRNLSGNKKPIGASQVTVVVERTETGSLGSTYQINLIAKLVPPHYIKLANPTVISDDLRAEISTAGSLGYTKEKWLSLAARARMSNGGASLTTSP